MDIVYRKAAHVADNVLSGNIVLTQEELDTISDILARNEVKGVRYFEGPLKDHLHLWG